MSKCVVSLCIMLQIQYETVPVKTVQSDIWETSWETVAMILETPQTTFHSLQHVSDWQQTYLILKQPKPSAWLDFNLFLFSLLLSSGLTELLSVRFTYVVVFKRLPCTQYNLRPDKSVQNLAGLTVAQQIKNTKCYLTCSKFQCKQI